MPQAEDTTIEAPQDTYFEAEHAETPALEFEADEPAPKSEAKAAEPKPDDRILRLRRMAAHFGISAERVSGYSPDALEAAVETAAEHVAMREQITRDAIRQQRPQPEKVATPEEDEFDWGEIEAEDDYGQRVRRKATEKDFGASANLFKTQQKKIKEMESRLAQRDKRDAEAETLTFRDAADEAFDALGAGFGEVLGTGEVAQDSDEFFARAAIWDQAAKEANKIGQKPTPKQWKALVEKTARRMYGKLAKTPPPVVDAPEQGGYGGRLAGANGNGHQPNSRSEAARSRQDPVTKKFRSNDELEHEREEAERRQAFFGSATERTASRRSPAEATGRMAAIAYLDDIREQLGGEDSPSDDYDANGHFVP